MWTIIDVINKNLRCDKYSKVFIVGLSERETLLRYGKENSDIDIELCYPGPIGFGIQRVGLSGVDLIRALRECKRNEREYIGVVLFKKSKDEMNSRERIVTDIIERYNLTESKVKKAVEKGKRIVLELYEKNFIA